MTELCLSLFGGFVMERAGEPIKAFESDKARTLIAYLAVEAHHLHRREWLAGLFWPETPENRARHSLSQVLSSLKAQFQEYPGNPILEATPQEVRFRSESCWLDVREFDDLVQACATHGHPPEWPCCSCLARLERAAALYQGDFLAGFSLPGCAAFEEWLLLQQEAYRQKLIGILGRLVHGLEASGELEKALAHASRQVALNPLDEAAHRQVMRLLSRQGRRLDALAQYVTCQEILLEELGESPGEATITLYQSLLEKPEAALPLPTSPHNLPIPLTRLVGRQAELEQLTLKFADPTCRLVTILGTGGTGKSRLALEAGHHLLPAFPDGVFLVELDTQTLHQALEPLIARAIGQELRPEIAAFGPAGHTGTVEGQLFSYLSDRRLLLILDGFEGLLHEAGLVSRLLHRAPQVKVLVTSRARLSLEAERIFLLEGLAYPAAAAFTDPLQYSAVQLFVEAAQRIDPGFALTEGDRLAVAEICQVTRGLPLGILLAASWAGMLRPGQILVEIHRSLDFLAAGWQDLPDRQRSLRATFDHSWQLLSERERGVFLRLALFHAPFTAERAAQVAEAALQDLRRLVDQSLLMPASEERYRIHDLLRQYAQEKLAALPGENLAAHKRHSQVYLQALAEWEPRLKNRVQPEALREIDQEYADILAAWEWGLANQEWEWLGKAFCALSYYYDLRSLNAMKAGLCQKAMDTLESQAGRAANRPLWLMLATGLLEALNLQVEYASGLQLIQQVEARLQEWGDLAAEMRRETASFYQIKGFIILNSDGNRLQALESELKGLELSYAEEDPHALSSALTCAAVMHGQVGNVRETGQFAREALAIQQSIGNPALLAIIYQHLGFYAMLSGDYQVGLQYAQAEKDSRLRCSGGRNRAFEYESLALALYYAGQYEQARSLLDQALPFFVIPEQEVDRKFALYVLTWIDLHTGHYAAALTARPCNGVQLTEGDLAALDLIKAQVHLLEADMAAPFSEAVLPDFPSAEKELRSYLHFVKALPRLDMIGQPLALLGYIAYRRGRMDEAQRYLEDALENGLKQGFFVVFLLSLSVLAVMLAKAGELEQAVELYATVNDHPFAGNSRWFEDMFGKRLAALSASLPAETIAAAQARGRAGDLFTVGQEYLEKLRSSAAWINPVFRKSLPES